MSNNFQRANNTKKPSNKMSSFLGISNKNLGENVSETEGSNSD